MQKIIRGVTAGLTLSFAVVACSSSTEKPNADELTTSTSQAADLPDYACTNLYTASVTQPEMWTEVAFDHDNGCRLHASVTSPDAAYGFASCDQYVVNPVHVESTDQNTVTAVPADPISDAATCASIRVKVTVYARNDRLGNVPWSFIGQRFAYGQWTAGQCDFSAASVTLPTSTTFSSIVAAGATYRPVVWKGTTTWLKGRVTVAVHPSC
jgi:hypothetical protein